MDDAIGGDSMGGIRTAIELQDNFSGVLYNVCGAVNLAISSIEGNSKHNSLPHPLL